MWHLRLCNIICYTAITTRNIAKLSHGLKCTYSLSILIFLISRAMNTLIEPNEVRKNYSIKVVTKKKEPLFSTQMITIGFILHFVLACISFNFHILNMGISMQQANIGLLLLEVIKPLILACLLAPFIAMGRHTDFKSEFKMMLFIGSGFSILYSLVKLLGVVG